MLGFKDDSAFGGVIKVAFVLFIGLSFVNLYYSIRVNRALNKKLKDES
jgi:hypothetical protein